MINYNESGEINYELEGIEELRELKEKIKAVKVLYDKVSIFVRAGTYDIDYDGLGNAHSMYNKEWRVDRIGRKWIYVKNKSHEKIKPYSNFKIRIKYE